VNLEIEERKRQVINVLLRQFKSSNHYRKTSNKRKERHRYNSEWIRPEKIKELNDEELTQRFIEYYSGGEGRQRFNQIWRDRIIGDIMRFRNMLLYLFDETKSLSERFNNVVEHDGQYYIEGVGKGLASALLMDFNIEKYCLWNNKTEMGLNQLNEITGQQLIPKKGKHGERYERILQILKALRDEIAPELNLTFDDIDNFLHWIAAEEEGIEAVNKIISDKERKDYLPEIPTPDERYITDILYQKFDELLGQKFNLQLYDDPDNEAKEYPTAVGRIDILAKDRNDKSIVVIEVKRNPSSSAVGQILKYVGWIRENLAKEKQVKGIILADKIDEELVYAVKATNNITILQYKINIEIEEIKI